MTEFFKAVAQHQEPKKNTYYITVLDNSILYAGTEEKANAIEITSDQYRMIIIAGMENLVFSDGRITNKKYENKKIIEKELRKSRSEGYVLLEDNPFWIVQENKQGELYQWQKQSE